MPDVLRDDWLWKEEDSKSLRLASLWDSRTCTVDQILVAMQVRFCRSEEQILLGAPEVEQLVMHPEEAVELAHGLLRAAKGAFAGAAPDTIPSQNPE